MVLPVTLTAAGAAALINLWLAIRVGRVRTAEKISMGDAGNERLIATMRAHANFVEYTPFILILIGLIELAEGTSTWLWVVAIVYLIARIAHALGMTGLPNGRVVGTVVTLLTLAALGIAAIVIPHVSTGQVTPVEIIDAG